MASETETEARSFTALEFLLMFAGIVVAILALLTRFGGESVDMYMQQGLAIAGDLYRQALAAIQ